MKPTGSGAAKRTTGGSTYNQKKQASVSNMLEAENKKMEEKLALVKQMMELDKNKRTTGPQSNQATKWRSATTKQPMTKGYQEAVIQAQKNTQRRPPVASQNQQQTAQTSSQQANKPPVQSNQFYPQQDSEQQSEFPEVTQFLSEIKLDKYKQKFIENGVEDMEIILELNDSHLDAMSIPLGHKLKIIKKIKEVRAVKGMSVPEARESRQGSRPMSSVSTVVSNIDANVRPATKNDYSELPDPSIQAPPKKMQQKKQVTVNQQATAVRPQVAQRAQPVKQAEGSTQSTQPNSRLIEGQFNEDESHATFVEAINAWRQSGDPNASIKEKKNYANSKSDVTEPNQPIKVSSKSTPKESCWQCYKLFISEQGFECGTTKKRFCTERCLVRYQDEHMQPCQINTCGKKFFKNRGFFIHGRWFCNEECSQKDPAVADLENLYKNGISFDNPEGQEDGTDKLPEDFEL